MARKGRKGKNPGGKANGKIENETHCKARGNDKTKMGTRHPEPPLEPGSLEPGVGDPGSYAKEALGSAVQPSGLYSNAISMEVR